jgi:CDP-paratose 2-epimerase
MIEAIDICEELAGEELEWTYTDTNRIGDHIWWVSDTSRFASHYPEWRLEYDVPAILKDILDRNRDRWHSAGVVDRVSS